MKGKTAMARAAITISILMSISLLCGATVHADKIKMGYFMLPPHQFKNDDSAAEPRGAGITFFDQVASKMGDSVEWIGPLPLPRLTEYLKAGTVVAGTVGFPKFVVFEKFLYYPEKPMFMAQPILGLVKDHPLSEIKTIDDIRGFRIGLVKSQSGQYDPLIDTHREAIHLEELGGERWMQQNLEKLIAGRLDAVFDRQKDTMRFVAATLNVSGKIKILSMPSPPLPIYAVFSKASPQGKALLARYNAAISQVTLNYEQLVDKEIQAVLKSNE
jgi:ABC-type amino acid transport substrate-binding protein